MAKKGCEDLPDECWELIFNKLHQRHHSLLESLSLSCKRFLSLTNALRTHLTIVDPRVHPVSTLLNRFPNLNSIDLSCSCDGDTFDLCSFTPHLTLEPLDVQRMTIEVAAANLNLDSLSFSGTQLHLESLRILGSRMKNLKVLMCSQLRTLRDLELLAIADSMPCLEDLDISYPNCPLLEDITMEAANLGGGDRATEIVENPRIKSLNLEYYPNLSDECLAKLASVCPSLEVLDVSCCMGITEKGIADFLKSGSKIRKLHIVECPASCKARISCPLKWDLCDFEFE
ncbi:hypothetical protein RHGRI_017491 [Rhododendron griersonianum]|uniref:F-box/LRR-repeat protein n=1 Tax=Rhododendron griersonianum TaxID=479676 RepID=A0AAV6JY30_9ERIC|nr:hypothetical protein RHGRI_017491 [Rhododendron griersonianum]